MKRLVQFVLTLGLFAVAAPVRAEVLYGLTTAGTVVTFDSDAPGTVSGSVAVTGLDGQSLLGIDFRPTTGQLYGLGSGGQLFIVDPLTGVATAAATLTPSVMLSAADGFGMDFNPTVDRLRVVSSTDANLRINVDTGLVLTDTPLNYAGTDVNAGANPNVVGSAYTNNFAGATSTTLFGIDSDLGVLVTQIPPNAGALNTIGSLGVATTGLVGFDISGISGIAYASLTPSADGPSRLYTIDLMTGAATDVGAIGDGSVTLVGLAAAPVPEPASLALMGLGLGAVLLRRRRK